MDRSLVGIITNRVEIPFDRGDTYSTWHAIAEVKSRSISRIIFFERDDLLENQTPRGAL